MSRKSLYDGLRVPHFTNTSADKPNQQNGKTEEPIPQKKPATTPKKNTNTAPRTPAPTKQEPLKPKYILTNDTITVDGHKLHRIQAIRDIPQIGVYSGDLGGYIESERNLEHRGSCWVFPDGLVYHNAIVRDGATVRDHAKAYDNAIIEGNAALYDKAEVFEKGYVGGGAKVYHEAIVHSRAKVFGEACIGDFAQISGMSQVYGRARIMGSSIVVGDIKIHGDYETTGGNYITGDVGKDTDSIDER